MKRKWFSDIYLFVYFAAGLTVVSACNSGSAKDCSVEFRVSQAHFSSYYKTKDSLELILALKTLNGAGNCPDYRRGINALKISALFLLQRYQEVFNFIDSCSRGDFSKPYQKSFSKNFALAKRFEHDKNYPKRDSLFGKNLNIISDFLRSADRPRLDTTAVYDYFYTESQFLPKDKYLSGIDSAEKKHPADSALFKAFRGSFYPSEATAPSVNESQPNAR